MYHPNKVKILKMQTIRKKYKVKSKESDTIVLLKAQYVYWLQMSFV